MARQLHIICLDVPYPVDYGGVFDLFYKITALHAAGIQIHLHCYEYGRGQQPELNKYCQSVHYYKRKEGHKGFSTKLPYIVGSRINEDLALNLLKDNHPILIEGVHCSWIVNDARFAGRKMILRLHNVEYRYYAKLAQSTGNLMKKIYYRIESWLLKKYEAQLAQKLPVLTVSEQDSAIYQKEFGAKHISYLPVFTPFTEVKAQSGIGCFCLYHGNLSVEENIRSAGFLLSQVFNDINIPLVVAGKNPPAHLEQLAHSQKHTCIVANPGWQEMQDMIEKAQINIIPSYNNTGIKLKLLNVLFNGRHCVVNDATVQGTGLEPACHSASSAAALKSLIIQLYHQPFPEEEVTLRKKMLESTYNNEQNVQRLLTWLY